MVAVVAAGLQTSRGARAEGYYALELADGAEERGRRPRRQEMRMVEEKQVFALNTWVDVAAAG